ncbi:MAG: GNAT family N-acetyltransferase, partial [Rhodococcus sp.]|nr:GNAT family N-acetyltransferase [Rhodococcus sp. (in: high G+C Gram-positive bacteria)]
MIRRARPDDCAAITDMIYQLAEHLGAREQCTVSRSDIERALFSPGAAVFAHVAVSDTSGTAQVVGIAVWFRNFSTWDGTQGIYLEDLFVSPT